ncbi:MAG: hypothetical protein KDC18_13325 [Alphaproteobacteria bacterium]|nr:hypothetical protein [Alphaproteobacteria bacterium]MCB9929291.1 hypothetical protein [Alphaproteobacteria bacterium]
MAATTLQEHLWVAFRLARREGQAVDEIANTQAAFWYSFQAALITLPMMVITVLLDYGGFPGALEMLAEVALFVVGWLLFPVAMLEIAPAIDRMQFYCRYIAASNWCSVFEDGLLTLVVVLRALDVIPGAIGGLLFFAGVVWVFSYQFFVARNALRIDAGVAAMIIGARLLLAIVLFIARGIIGGA